MFLKGALYYKLENATVALAPKIRQIGQQLYARGVALQGNLAHEDTLQPSLRCLPSADGKFPNAFVSDWIAPNAVMVGNVSVGEGSSVWHGATLRGDQAKITIGKNSMIQDNSRLGSNAGSNGKIVIGDNVFVGPNARLEECELESFAYVGMGASVGRGCIVESFGVLAAGAKLGDGETVPTGQIYAGSPAKYLRDLTQ
jgi:carbonic anhydrase/acetyltransferase-like protein (isoleucine patch superfamily)